MWVSYLASDEQGRRMDSARGYLDPVLDDVCAGNLQIIQGATALNLVLEGGRATGVQYSQAGANTVCTSFHLPPPSPSAPWSLFWGCLVISRL